MSILGQWARGRVAADGAIEETGEATSASYLLDSLSFNYTSLFRVLHV